MCMGGGYDAPEAKAPAQPKQNSAQVQMAQADEMRRRAAARGVGNSRLSGPLGDINAVQSSGKKLLGG